jgi:flagellar basal-body rod protein FlgB
VTLNDIPLFAMLKGKLQYENQRQTLVAQNVANADTPDYAPRDLKAFTFDQAMQSQSVAMVRTNAMDIASAPSSGGAAGDQASPDSEVRLDGNHVVLEDQMMKLTEARMDYDAAVGLYQQSLQLLKTAIKKPGS